MTFEPSQGLALAHYARACIRVELGGPPAVVPSGFEAEGACFVTLRFGETLQGCIGSIVPRRALIEDVAENARAAAFRDSRGMPLALGDIDALSVEVSILSPLTVIEFTDEESAIRALRPFEDGVVIRAGRHHGTFLPQVWESLPDPREFLTELKRKAMLPRNYWSAEVELLRYRVDKFIDPGTIELRRTPGESVG